MARNFSLISPRGSSPGRSQPPALRPSGALAALLLVCGAGCIPSSPPAGPPSDSFQQPPASAAEMGPGTRVQVARQGQWYGATVVMAAGDGRFLVHYDNTGNEWNEAVGPERIKPLPAMAPGAPGHDYRPGEKVLVTYQNRLLLAEVVEQVAADAWRVHYDGFGAEASEIVGPDRMQRPFTGASAHVPGDAVTVDVKGQAVAAKVLAASAKDRWVVRFEAFGPQYDQEVGADRLRPAPGAVAPEAPPAKVQKPAEKPAEKAEKPAEQAKAKPAPPAPADGPPAAPTGAPAVGESVLVSLRGAWLTASVTAVGTGTVKVKFGAGGEEDVAADHILRVPASTKGQHYQPGQLVLVDFKGVFVPGKVLKEENKGEYKVRFDGQGPDADEVIVSRRLRPR